MLSSFFLGELLPRLLPNSKPHVSLKLSAQHSEITQLSFSHLLPKEKGFFISFNVKTFLSSCTFLLVNSKNKKGRYPSGIYPAAVYVALLRQVLET